LSSQISEDDTPRRKRAIFESRKAVEEDPLLILKGMVPARTHPNAFKQDSVKNLEKELAYYMGEIEKKFNDGELKNYKFERTTQKPSQSQPPPVSKRLRHSNSTSCLPQINKVDVMGPTDQRDTSQVRSI